MVSSIYLGVRLLEKPYERLKLTDINFSTKKISDLKVDAEKLLNCASHQLEFIYCGTILKDDKQSLAEHGIKEGSTIHVFPKQEEEVHFEEPINEDQIQRAVVSYRLIMKDISGSSLAKAIRPEVIKKVLDAYPELHHNLGAFAILKDAILIGRMSSLETAKEIGKQYPILIRSAEFVTKTMREHLALTKKDLSPNTVPSEDSLSDTSSSEGDAPMANQGGDIRQISRDQLSAALLLAGTASLNSLSNIAQRNSGPGVGGAPAASTSQSIPSTSASISTAQSTSSSTTGANLLSRSLFSNALAQALGQAAPPSATATAGAPSNEDEAGATGRAAINENMAERYANELQLMREMGLFDEITNVQALVVSNGNVESAINLVLGGFSNSF